MNKKKIFDLKLFIEGIRQLRIIGFIFMIFYAAEAFLIPYNMYDVFNLDYLLSDMHPMVYGMHMAFVPCMTLYLFGFLLKRNSSDFFQSIPHSRTCVFISFFSSILFWTVSIIFVSTAVSITSSYLMFRSVSISWSKLLLSLFGIVIASITVEAGICVAQSITGTILSNIIVSGLILLAPKIFSLFIVENISENAVIFDVEHFSPVLTGKYNLVTSFLNTYRAGGFTDSFMSRTSIIYTGLLFLLYFAIALFLFNIRKSETAGNPAANALLQNIYRIVFTLLLCLLPINIIITEYDDVRNIVSIYIVIAIAYFVYEILTTHKVKNLPKAIPGLTVVALLNVLIIFGITSVIESIQTYTPDADSLKSISLYANIPDRNYYTYGDYSITITDAKNKEAFCRCLQKFSGKSEYDIDIDYNEYPNSYQVCFTDTSGENHYRKLPLNAGMIKNAITTVTESDENISFPKLPSPNQVFVTNSNYSDDSIYKLNHNFTHSQMRYLYKAFIADFNNMSSEQKLMYVFNILNTDSNNNIDKFSVLYNDTNIDIYVTESNTNLFNTYFDTIEKNGIVDTKGILKNFEDEILSYSENTYVDILNQNMNTLASLDGDEDNYGFDYPEKYDTFINALKDLSEYVIVSPGDIKDCMLSKKNYTIIYLDYDLVYRDNTYYNIPVLLEDNDEVTKILETIKKTYN